MNEQKRVKDVMTQNPITVQQNKSLQETVDLMTEHNISCVLVVDTHKQLTGIITERDLVQRVLHQKQDPKKLKNTDVMTKSITSISEQATLQEAMQTIKHMNVRRLVVVGDKGLKGIITQTDLVEQTHDIHEHNQRLTFHQNLQSYIIIASIILFMILLAIKKFF